MKIINFKDVEKRLVTMKDSFGVDMQVPIGVDDDTPAYSMRIFTVIPGGHTPYHDHPFEHINYIISGEGVVNTEDGPFWITEGDCILIEPGKKHNYENLMSNDGDEVEQKDLVFVCLVPKDYECGCPDDKSNEEKADS